MNNVIQYIQWITQIVRVCYGLTIFFVMIDFTLFPQSHFDGTGALMC